MASFLRKALSMRLVKSRGVHFDNARDCVRRYIFADHQDQLSLPLDDISGIGNSYDVWGVIRKLRCHCY